MEIMQLIQELEEYVEKAAAVPLTGKALIDKDELMDIIQDMKQKLPENIKEAKWIKEERNRIMVEAQKEANTIIKNAEAKIVTMINENEITKKATEQATEMLQNAQNRSKEIKMATRQYTDDMLASLEKNIRACLKMVTDNRTEFRNQGNKAE